MEWKTRIELTYRGYARQHRAIEDQFTTVVDAIASRLEGSKWEHWVDDLIVGSLTAVHIPIAEESLQKAQDKGLLILQDDLRLVVRQWPVTIKLREDGNASILLDFIRNEIEGKFTNIKVVEEAFTDVPPQ